MMQSAATSVNSAIHFNKDYNAEPVHEARPEVIPEV